LPALLDLGLEIKAIPQGAFYIYANCQHLLNDKIPDSMALAKLWLQQAGVAATPGNDFGNHMANNHIRFAYTAESNRLLEALERIRTLGN
jgi:aspartate/methionine/tyrosine aminotransferase